MKQLVTEENSNATMIQKKFSENVTFLYQDEVARANKYCYSFHCNHMVSIDGFKIS